jgi:hypothetical protein
MFRQKGLCSVIEALDSNSRAKFFSSGNIAFVIVVCASYASMIAALIYLHRPVPAWEVAVLAVVGIAYPIAGTFGFSRCRRSASRLMRVGYFVIQMSLTAVLILLRGSSGELSLILLPLAGQSALLLSMNFMVPVCVLIYVTLVACPIEIVSSMT